jgi:hypothetical protein
LSHQCEVIKPAPNPPQADLIAESIDAQLPRGTRLRFCFDEPLMSSDAGLLLLAREAADRGDISRIAQALAPKLKPRQGGERTRRPRAPLHGTESLLTQRVMQMIGGYPDGLDSNLLRHDPVLQMLVSQATPGTPQAVLASQPTMSRLDNSASLRPLVRAFDAMVDNFIASYGARGPNGLVLDLDPTACIVYGQQELGMFNTHVGDTCLMPFHLYEGESGRLIATALHPGKTPQARAIIGILRRVVKRLRKVWPRVGLVFRADGHHSKPEVLAWLEAQGIDYLIGYAPNAVLERQFAGCIRQARQRYARHVAEGRSDAEARTFDSGHYSAKSWQGETRRIVCRAIAGPHGVDARFIVTSFEVLEAQRLYTQIYCGRGRAELCIKDHKLGLTSDRLSCTRKEGNAMRLLIASLAYQVLDGFRRRVLGGSALAKATFGEIRMKLFKLAARVRVLKTRIEVHLAARHPGSEWVAQLVSRALATPTPRVASG